MVKLNKGRGAKSGLPPGTLVHIGKKREEEVTLRLVDYTAEEMEDVWLATVEQVLPYRERPSVTWLDVGGVQWVEVVQKVGECFGLHPLVMEDILNTDQRPKLEVYDGYAFIVAKMLGTGEEGELVAEQVALVLGPGYVLSFREGGCGDLFAPVRERLRKGRGKIREAGADYLTYALLDAVVDHYFVVLEELGEELETLEDEVVLRPSPNTIRRIHALKRAMIFARRAVWPLREVLAALQRGETPLIQSATVVYLRDVYDHTIQTMDAVDTYRDMLSGMLDVYLSSLSNRMNEIMKFLTVIGTIFIPLTFISGIYGMNFQNMPELKWQWGYFAVLALMAVVAVVMLAYFRRKKWL